MNLISVGQLCFEGGNFVGNTTTLWVENLAGGKCIEVRLNALSSLWQMQVFPCALLLAHMVLADIWHLLLGHLNPSAVKDMDCGGF